MLNYVQVALPVPIDRWFDYTAPDTVPAIGARVQVPFGRKQLVGVVVGRSQFSDIADDKLRPIDEIIDAVPLFDTARLEFAQWLSGYYHYPLGETLSLMMPSLLRQGVVIECFLAQQRKLAVRQWRLTADYQAITLSATAKKQKRTVELLEHHGSLTDRQLAEHGILVRTLRAMRDKAIIELVEGVAHDAVSSSTSVYRQTLKEPALQLTAEQAQALGVIDAAMSEQRYEGVLLNGVTGSGKTEVYLQAIAKVLAAGRQALILVPEIGLTPQTKARFTQRFDVNVVMLHSKMNDKQRLAGFLACRAGQADVIIATRSSVLYDFANLGLIIVDEAHDPSYKQQDHLRYHACDVALYLGHLIAVPVVLATATPSLEQIKLVQDGKLHQCALSQRPSAKPPRLELVDMRLGQLSRYDLMGESWQMGLSQIAITAMRDALTRGEQVMVFLNRRGFAPIVLCQSCGYQADCVRCSSHLTLHKSAWHQTLKCHHCGYQTALPKQCPNCQSLNLTSLGQGTAQLTEHLQSIFANLQLSHVKYPVVRIDRDTITKKQAWETLYAQIQTGEPMILVGTQMIAKGHHFEAVSLVVVVDADAGFLSPDFRSPEHTAQTIIQVAGRAGRAGQAGRVLIQSYQPDRAELIRLTQHGYMAYAQDLLSQRARLGLPPYSHAVLVRAESNSETKAKAALDAAYQLLNQEYSPHPFAVMAPSNAPLYKRNNRYHTQMLILAKQRRPLHQMLDSWWQALLELPAAKTVKMSLDVDPMGF